MPYPGVNKAIDQIFRRSYGKMVSVLLRKFGLQALDSIEDAVMDSYFKALKTWPYNSIPSNPEGWLYSAARNSLIDTFRSQKKFTKQVTEEIDHRNIFEFEQERIGDPELQLLFLICHPELRIEDRLAFMLKTLSGFGDHEVANALLTKRATIKKRIQRARKTLHSKDIKFGWPGPSEISERRDLVHKCLYLLFNEGFYSSHKEKWVRKDLCLEAMRLCKYLSEHSLGNSDTSALMSLMCYHISRFESRLDQSGEIVLLDKQDRTKWDSYFIDLGHHYLEMSANKSDKKSKYQIEAFISAQHCMAPSVKETNWDMLLILYESLYQKEKNVLILLNLIVVLIQLDKVERAKDLYESIDSDKVHNKVTYYMVGIELYDKLRNKLQIELILEKVIQSDVQMKDRILIEKKLKNFRAIEKN